jgi:small-conductance mechanosensitive channel
MPTSNLCVGSGFRILMGLRGEETAMSRRIFATLFVWSLMLGFFVLTHGLSAEAQGLVGAPVDSRFSQLCTLCNVTDYGYDTARAILQTCTTVVVFACMAMLGCWHIKNAAELGLWQNRSGVCVTDTKKMIRSRMRQVVLTMLTPCVIYMVGTWFINNFGGIGGGL